MTYFTRVHRSECQTDFATCNVSECHTNFSTCNFSEMKIYKLFQVPHLPFPNFAWCFLQCQKTVELEWHLFDPASHSSEWALNPAEETKHSNDSKKKLISIIIAIMIITMIDLSGLCLRLWHLALMYQTWQFVLSSHEVPSNRVILSMSVFAPLFFFSSPNIGIYLRSPKQGVHSW